MEKFLDYCKAYLYFACGGFGIYVFNDMFFISLSCLVLMGGVYFISKGNKRFALFRCLLFYVSAVLILANIAYLLFMDNIFAYKECFQRILFSLWFISPPAVIDLFVKTNWK